MAARKDGLAGTYVALAERHNRAGLNEPVAPTVGRDIHKRVTAGGWMRVTVRRASADDAAVLAGLRFRWLTESGDAVNWTRVLSSRLSPPG